MFIVLHAAPFTYRCTSLLLLFTCFCIFSLSWCNDRLANLALLNFGRCDIRVTGVVLDRPKKGLDVYLISWTLTAYTVISWILTAYTVISWILTAYTLISWILTIYRVSVSLTLSA